MSAQIQELTNHYKLWNDHDEWYVEKATGVQVANDLSEEWAHIWAGFQYQINPGDPWEEKRIDALSWTWTTDSGADWVKLIGDAYFAPGDTVHVHIEWTLEDTDQLIEFKWKTTNDWQDINDVRQVIRNGRIDVNGGGADCWYRFYKNDGTLLSGQLPADVSYNNITDSLKNRYKLIGKSKDIDWRWDETYDKNGTPTASDVTVNVVDTNGPYGSNGYVEHVFNIGAVDQGEYVETVQHWHDAETYYLASFRNFEMDGSGTSRNYQGGSVAQRNEVGGTNSVFGTTASDWTGNSFVAGYSFSITELEVQMRKVNSPPGNISCEIYSATGTPGTPNASLGIATETYDGGDLTTANTWYKFAFSSPVSITSGTHYFIVLKTDAQNDNDYFTFNVNVAGTNSRQRYDSGWTELDSTSDTIYRLYAVGNTLDSDKWFGMCYPTNDKSTHTINDADDKVAIKFTGVRSLDKVAVYITASASSPILAAAIQGDNAGDPDGSDIANLSGTQAVSGAGWHEVTFTGATLTEGTSYHLVLEIDSFGAGDSITFATALLTGEDLTSDWFQTYDEYEAAWAGASTAECLCALMYGQSDAGYYSIMRYGTDESMLVGSGAIGSARWPTIKNDETTLYRTVIQIKPLDDAWITTKDAENEGWFDESSGSDTNWSGFETATDDTNKLLIDEGSGPEAAGDNILNSDDAVGVQTAEWNSTDTNIIGPGTPPTQAGVLDSTDNRFENFESGGTNWQDDGVGLSILQDNWGTWEYWFKVVTEFAVDDVPEVKYYNAAGGGHVELAGLRFSYLVITAAVDTFSKMSGITYSTIGKIDDIAIANISKIDDIAVSS